MDSKLLEHSEQVEGEDRVFRDCEVVEEASTEDESADGDSGSYKGFGIR